jgi:hypothetical protein
MLWPVTDRKQFEIQTSREAQKSHRSCNMFSKNQLLWTLVRSINQKPENRFGFLNLARN